MVLINSVIGKLLLVFAYFILKEIGAIFCNGVYAICFIYMLFGENYRIYYLYLYSCCKRKFFGNFFLILFDGSFAKFFYFCYQN